MDYQARRKHIRRLIDKSEVSLSEVARWAGRHETRAQYQWVWQVLDGRGQSSKVLDDLEEALRDRGLWEDQRSWFERWFG